MDEATLIKFGKWIDCGKQVPPQERRLGHATLFKIFMPINISGMLKAILFKFGKWIDYRKSHPRGKKFPPKGAWYWVM